MADLVGLYRESGLAGIVPHAFKKNGSAFNFLIEKLKTETGMYYLKSAAVKTPFIGVDESGVCAYLYIDKLGAEHQQQILAKTGYITSAEELPNGKARVSFFERLRDIGVDLVLVNDAIHIPVLCYVSAVDYDGYMDINRLLRNAELNATLNFFCQDAASGSVRFNVQEYLCDLLKNGRFLAPIAVVGDRAKQMDFSPADIEFQTVTDASRNTFLLCFTDWFEFNQYMVAHHIKEGTYGGYVVDWDTMQQLMEENPDVSIALNPQTANIKLSLEVMAQMMTHSLNMKAMRQNGGRVKASKYGESPALSGKPEQGSSETAADWQTEDPTPDWLK